MNGLRMTFRDDVYGNPVVEGIRDETGYILFFRTIARYSGQEPRYEKEVTEINAIAEKILQALKAVQK